MTVMHQHLLLQENNRRDVLLRSLCWNPLYWEQTFQQGIAAEQARETYWMRHLEVTRLGTAQLYALENELYTTIEQDIHWYQHIMTVLEQTGVQWIDDPDIEPIEWQQWLLHRYLIEMRWYEQRVRLAQMTLECFERQRTVFGRLPNEVWGMGWQHLQKVRSDQDNFFASIADASPWPRQTASITAVRCRALRDAAEVQRTWLRWCQQLQRTQWLTRHKWRRSAHGDVVGAARDAAEVEREIQRWLAAPPHSLVKQVSDWVLAFVVAMLVIT